eukprot:jgi/Botrbrau1/19609/Bobra.0035s0086.1
MNWTNLLARWFSMLSPRGGATFHQGGEHVVSLNPAFSRPQNGKNSQARGKPTRSPSTNKINSLRGSPLGLDGSPKCFMSVIEQDAYQKGALTPPICPAGSAERLSSSFHTASVSSLSPKELAELLDRLEYQSSLRQAGISFQALTPPTFQNHESCQDPWFTARQELTPAPNLSGMGAGRRTFTSSAAYPVRQLIFSPVVKPAAALSAVPAEPSDFGPSRQGTPGGLDIAGGGPSPSSTSPAGRSEHSTLQASTRSSDGPQRSRSPPSASSSVRSAQLASLLQELELEEDAGPAQPPPRTSAPAFPSLFAPSESASSTGGPSPSPHWASGPASIEFHSVDSSRASCRVDDPLLDDSFGAESLSHGRTLCSELRGPASLRTPLGSGAWDEGDSPVLAWTTGRRRNTRRIVPDDDDEGGVQSAVQATGERGSCGGSARPDMAPWVSSPPARPNGGMQDTMPAGALSPHPLSGSLGQRPRPLPPAEPPVRSGFRQGLVGGTRDLRAAVPEGRTPSPPHLWLAGVPPPSSNQPAARDLRGASASAAQNTAWASLIDAGPQHQEASREGEREGRLPFPLTQGSERPLPPSGRRTPSPVSSAGSDLRFGRSTRKPRFCFLEDSEGSDAEGRGTLRGEVALSPQRAAPGAKPRRSPVLYASACGPRGGPAGGSGGEEGTVNGTGGTRSEGVSRGDGGTAGDREGAEAGLGLGPAGGRHGGRGDPYEFPDEARELGEAAAGFDRGRLVSKANPPRPMLPPGAVLAAPGMLDSLRAALPNWLELISPRRDDKGCTPGVIDLSISDQESPFPDSDASLDDDDDYEEDGALYVPPGGKENRSQGSNVMTPVPRRPDTGGAGDPLYAVVLTPPQTPLPKPPITPATVAAFRRQRDSLTASLYQKFNRGVFAGRLPADMRIEWNPRLTSTAGRTYQSKSLGGIPGSGFTYKAWIELSSKVLDTPQKLEGNAAARDVPRGRLAAGQHLPPAAWAGLQAVGEAGPVRLPPYSCQALPLLLCARPLRVALHRTRVWRGVHAPFQVDRHCDAAVRALPGPPPLRGQVQRGRHPGPHPRPLRLLPLRQGQLCRCQGVLPEQVACRGHEEAVRHVEVPESGLRR